MIVSVPRKQWTNVGSGPASLASFDFPIFVLAGDQPDVSFEAAIAAGLPTLDEQGDTKTYGDAIALWAMPAQDIDAFVDFIPITQTPNPLLSCNSLGINRITGKAITDWDDVVQSLNVIWATRIGTRVMRRYFGSAVPGLLGHNLTPITLQHFFVAVTMAIDLWEPRVRILQVLWPSSQNLPQNWQVGHIAFQVVAVYMPRALSGDFTREPIPRIARLSI